MAQHDYVIANQSGAAFRADLNNALSAIVSLNSGATAPSTTFAYQLWADTTTGLLKIRNAANSAWITLRELDGTLTIENGTNAAPGLAFASDLDTGIYRVAADQLAIATGGTGRLFIDDGGRVMVGVSTALTNAYAIGTALTPVVQIQGNTANGAALSITRQTSAAANLLLQRGVTGTPVVDTDAVGQISFNGFDGTNYFNAALIRGVIDGTPGTGSMPGRLSFQTTPSGSTTPVERLRLDPAGQIFAASLGTAALPVWSFTGDPNTGIWSPAADTLAASTGGSERARIDSDGRVGIGVTPWDEINDGPQLTLRGWGGQYYNALTITGGAATPANNTNKGGYISGARYSNTGKPFVVMANWDSGSDRYIAIGGGGWSTVDANNIYFYTAPAYNETENAGLERLRITTDGYVRLASGTGGIQFNGDTAAANALDDYEEGTWTPAYAFGTSGSVTHGTRRGSYTKIGNVVIAVARISTTTLSSPSGNVSITGLPFTSSGTEHSAAIGLNGSFASNLPIKLLITSAGTTIGVAKNNSDAQGALLQGSDFATGTDSNLIDFTLVYRAA